jgi:hypothetical protein
MFSVFGNGVDHRGLSNSVDQRARMIEMAASSIRLSYPEAEIRLLSNLPNSETGLPDFIHTDLVDANFDTLVLSKIREYKALLDRTNPEGHLVFCDPDMLLLRRIDKLFKKDDFDIALTLRNYSDDGHDAPINAGFYVVNMRAKDRICGLFKDFVQAIEDLPESEHLWDGDQTALARILGAPLVDLVHPCFAQWNDIRIKYLPVRIYNNTPGRRQRRFYVFHPHARVLHFKASKKSFMGAYYRLYVTSMLGKLLRQKKAQRGRRIRSERAVYTL